MRVVIDTSVVVTVLKRETGWQHAEPLIPQSIMSQVNLLELATVLARQGMSQAHLQETLTQFPCTIKPLCDQQILWAASFIQHTKSFGLSLGDRVCLALAKTENIPVYTADKAWQNVASPLDIDVRFIR